MSWKLKRRATVADENSATDIQEGAPRRRWKVRLLRDRSRAPALARARGLRVI